jgi:hypothetical protein
MYKRAIGYIAITLGILISIYTSSEYATTEKTRAINILRYPIQWTPIVGVLISLTGLMIIMISNKKPPKNL